MENQPKIRVFSTPSCPYCFTLKEYLKERGFDFEDIDVASNKEALEEMSQKSGQMSVPVVDIGGEMIVGFDKEKINKLLNIQE